MGKSFRANSDMWDSDEPEYGRVNKIKNSKKKSSNLRSRRENNDWDDQLDQFNNFNNDFRKPKNGKGYKHGI